MFELMAKTENTDDEMQEACSEQDEAIHRVLETPIGVPHQFLEKFDFVEELVVREDTMGPSTDKYAVLGMASLKRDILHLNDLHLTNEDRPFKLG